MLSYLCNMYIADRKNRKVSQVENLRYLAGGAGQEKAETGRFASCYQNR